MILFTRSVMKISHVNLFEYLYESKNYTYIVVSKSRKTDPIDIQSYI